MITAPGKKFKTIITNYNFFSIDIAKLKSFNIVSIKSFKAR